MKKVVLFPLLLLLLAAATMAQPRTDQHFLTRLTGTWTGTMQWMVAGKADRSFAMQLRIAPGDSALTYTWSITYGEDGKDQRPYLLKAVDTSAQHWVIDEGNGILLDCYLQGNTLHGAFSVAGNTIVDNYSLEQDQLEVEFFSFRLASAKRSGKGSEDAPFVDSYQLASYQRGYLKKIKDQP